MQCSFDIVPEADHAICVALQLVIAGRHRELYVMDTVPIDFQIPREIQSFLAGAWFSAEL